MEGESKGWRSVNDDDSFIGQAFCFMVKTTRVNDRRKAKGAREVGAGAGKVSKGSEGATETTLGKKISVI